MPSRLSLLLLAVALFVLAGCADELQPKAAPADGGHQHGQPGPGDPAHADHAPGDHSHKGHSHGEHRHDHSARQLFTTRPHTKLAPLPREEGVFHFVVYGDRTGGVPAGLEVLKQAVSDTNLLDPDLVMTVGDLVQGYNKTPEWLEQAAEFQAIMNGLRMPWFPVAGNHDVYWERRDQDKPAGEHEASYEKHFGPLWYAFRHKNAGFIVLYSDEGDAESGEKGFHQPNLQTMSAEQLEFLEQALEHQRGQDHVFVFLHHPRWLGGNYGDNWQEVHKRLAAAGNVSAVFAGHIHHMRYDGERDGIEYFTLATTGGHLSADLPEVGYLHHYNVVTVRKESVKVATIPVGAVIDPKQFTAEFLDDVQTARAARPQPLGEPLAVSLDGSVEGHYGVQLTNPARHRMELTVVPEAAGDWTVWPDHAHASIGSDERGVVRFQFQRRARPGEGAGGDLDFSPPKLTVSIDYLTDKARIKLPAHTAAIPLTLAEVPEGFFEQADNRCLALDGRLDCVRIDSAMFDLPQGPFTLEAWVNPSASDGSRGVIAKTQASEYAIFANEGVPQFDVNLGGRYVTAQAEEALPTGRWTHVAGVYDGATVKLFLNGKLVDSQAGSGRRSTNELPLYLGADPTTDGSPTRQFAGQLDEVRLSRGARYSDDFQPAERFAPDEETVLLFHLDRAVGPLLLDHSPPRAVGVRLGEATLENR